MYLENERIYLRNLQVSDAPIMLENTTDEEIRYMTGTKPNFTLNQIKAHINNVNNDSSRYDFAICLKNNDQMIGELSIFEIDEENNKAGFRISMSSIELTGKGYGTEAIIIVLRFVFEELKLNRLQLEVFSHNLRGIRVYEKVGFVKEGVLRESLYYNGTYSDEVIMAILRKDYENLPLK
ncbi:MULTISPECIES: GNAT family N-acetyltransferase [unclassified Viridibacillus]|uniref:GNAT family N-acetyltransferase n=1 Tax=unclassified Viridibacillus TaxID=2617942 RepID=UPI00096C908A|nr:MULTISPECIES: GNAT family protein [unclassified Viridibacillus]OMC80950.1 GNAT family N-acetyltransferase [Viridibacillus sp. FSL H8-0123]OMC86616.1 GNAT family N-acetyltransferase [Viridibacillus sp. FSL H7-0596]